MSAKLKQLSPKLRNFFSNRVNVVLTAVLVLIVISGFFVVQKVLLQNKPPAPLEEIDLQFDPDGPYALTTPRRDGNAINLNIKRVSVYDAFSYELVYQSEGIDRGAGDGNTLIKLKANESEYTQEILFGTCSKGDTSDPVHCVFDKGIENGTLSLRLKKDNKLYKMLTTWHLQKPDVALGILSSADGHFTYQINAPRTELTVVGYSIINDLSGVPKLPNEEQVLGKVYALNIPVAKILPKGDVTIELIDNPPADAKIAYYNEAKNSWDLLDTKIIGSNKLKAQAQGAGIFAVLVNKSN